MQLIPDPTPREMDILKALWELGPSSVRDVHLHFLQHDEDLHFNTLQTMLRVMATKNLVTYEQEKRAFIYSAAFTRDQSTTRFLDNVFDGAVSELVMSLLRSESISVEELHSLQGMIDFARRQKQSKDPARKEDVE